MGTCLSKNDERTKLSKQFALWVEDHLRTCGTLLDGESNHHTLVIESIFEWYNDDPLVWIQFVKSVVCGVPIDHPKGTNVIRCALDMANQLPAECAVLLVGDMIRDSLRQTPEEERNLCLILGCLVENLDGRSSEAVLSETTLQYLLGILDEGVHPDVTLSALIALETFAQKIKNNSTRQILPKNLLLRLERNYSRSNYVWRQVGFCARWCLHNYFTIEGQKRSYENVKVKLNDVTEYLKVSADGLEVRCDNSSFESVRCTYQVNSGCWYYECLVITPGVMQIGWTTRDDPNHSRRKCGIGDDQYSIAFDGCRRMIWYNNESQSCDLPMWTGGSIVGCLLNVDAREVIFSLNGNEGGVLKQVFETAGDGFYAAASFGMFQQCRFNFGAEPFRYPPLMLFIVFVQSLFTSPRHN